MKITCPECNEISEASNFCPTCGHKMVKSRMLDFMEYKERTRSTGENSITFGVKCNLCQWHPTKHYVSWRMNYLAKTSKENLLNSAINRIERDYIINKGKIYHKTCDERIRNNPFRNHMDITNQMVRA